MPLGLALFLIVAVAFCAHIRGYLKGYKEAERYTEYWYKEYQQWRDIAFDLMPWPPKDPPDDSDDDEDEEEAPPPEPVKAIAKAAGVGR